VPRLRRFLLAGVVAALLGTFLATTPAEAAPPTGDIRIQNVNSGLCLSPAGGSAANNVQIVQYLCQELYIRSYYVTYSSTLGAYQIKNYANGKCLSPAGGSGGNNVAIVQYTCDSDRSRYWTAVKRSGSWTLRNLKTELCLSPAGGGTGLNGPIVQYSCDGNPARNWYLFGPRVLSTVTGDLNCATIAGSSATPNTVAVIYDCNASEDAARIWDFVATPTANADMLRNVGSGLCLSPAGGGTAVGTLVVQYYCDGQPARLWTIAANGGDQVHVVNNNSGLCLGSVDGSTGRNVALAITWCDSDASRNWYVLVP
jgi:hypothetical protein